MMEDYYQRHCIAYHAKTFRIDPASFLEPLIRHLEPGAEILDAGCGSGRDLLWLKERGFNVTGLEISKGLAGLAREQTGCEIIEADFEVYDFVNLNFDAILLSGALVHIAHARLEAVFGNIVSGLGAGGKVLVSLKQGHGSSMDQDGRTFFFWQDSHLRDIFAKQGFSVLEFHRDISKVNSRDTWLSYVLTR